MRSRIAIVLEAAVKRASRGLGPASSVETEASTTAAACSDAGVTRAGLIGAMLLAIVLIYVVAQSFLLETAACEVCMDYRGQHQCRTVGGETIEEARRAAITNACAFLSSGVTDSMACQRATPSSESCR